MKNILALITIVISFNSQASSITMNDLIDSAKKSGSQSLKVHEKRLEIVKMTQKERQAELQKQMSELKKVEAQMRVLTEKFNTNEKNLAQLENKKMLALGSLGEMFGVVKQVSGDLKGQLENSLTSSQFPGQAKVLEPLVQQKTLPKVDDLKMLWQNLLHEMVESGKTVKYKANVIKENGQKETLPVTRVGLFNLVADGKYLNFQPETQQIMVLPRQPERKHTSLIDDFENSKQAFAALSIDPSRGSLLSMLIQSPSLSERVEQGGLVGYVIIAILLLGIGLVIERFIFLRKEEALIKTQLKSKEVLLNNPIGRMIDTYKKYESTSTDTLEIKMEEEIARSVPQLEKGVGTIKLLAAIAPLLGLLGTVTGMIVTFQSITLFGTSDPKLMAGGISQALITTVFGLVCAIPLLLLHNLVNSKSKSLVLILEEQCLGLIAKKHAISNSGENK